jgi:hypothetical protein
MPSRKPPKHLQTRRAPPRPRLPHACADEWGSWGDAGGGASASRPPTRPAPAAPGGDAQWGGWDDGVASPSHVAAPGPGKKDDDEWGKW